MITEKKERLLYEDDADKGETNGNGGFDAGQTSFRNAGKQRRPNKTKIPKSNAVTYRLNKE